MEMPYTALQAFDIGTDDFGSIYIISEGNEYSAAVAQSALSLLDSRHQTPVSYTHLDVYKRQQEHLPVTTRGAGTGLCGGCVPIHGGIVMSMMRMNKILEIDEQTMNAVLQPGVLLMEIIEEAANHNLLYAPAPGEKSARCV